MMNKTSPIVPPAVPATGHADEHKGRGMVVLPGGKPRLKPRMHPPPQRDLANSQEEPALDRFKERAATAAAEGETELMDIARDTQLSEGDRLQRYGALHARLKFVLDGLPEPVLDEAPARLLADAALRARAPIDAERQRRLNDARHEADAVVAASYAISARADLCMDEKLADFRRMAGQLKRSIESMPAFVHGEVRGIYEHPWQLVQRGINAVVDYQVKAAPADQAYDVASAARRALEAFECLQAMPAGEKHEACVRLLAALAGNVRALDDRCPLALLEGAHHLQGARQQIELARLKYQSLASSPPQESPHASPLQSP